MSNTSISKQASTSNLNTNVNRGETEEFVQFLYREGFFEKGSSIETYDIHSITPSLSYLLHKYCQSSASNCHTVISVYSSLALKKQNQILSTKNNCYNLKTSNKNNSQDLMKCQLNSEQNLLENDLNIAGDVSKQFEDWRSSDIGIGFLLYGETGCFVLARMIEMTHGNVNNTITDGSVTCRVISNKFDVNLIDLEENYGSNLVENPYIRCIINSNITNSGMNGNVFILNPYLEVDEIQNIIKFEVQNSLFIKQLFSCRSDIIELGLMDFDLVTRIPCFLLSVKCSIDLTLPIYIYRRRSSSNISNSVLSKSIIQSDISIKSLYLGDKFQDSLEILVNFYTWLKNHLLNPKSPYFDLEYSKFYYSRVLELLSNIEYIVKISSNIEKGAPNKNINLNDIGLGMGLTRPFGISKFTTPNSRCSISTTASNNTPININDSQKDISIVGTSNNVCNTNNICLSISPENNINDNNIINMNTISGSNIIIGRGVGVQEVKADFINENNLSKKENISNSRNSSVSSRNRKNNVKFNNTCNHITNPSINTTSTLLPGTIVRFRSQIPVDAKLIQGVPEADYFTHVQQVYYHFQKGEWRAVYGPSKNRQQKSFSVNKYGFYEAKRLAEEWRLRYLYSHSNNNNNNNSNNNLIRSGRLKSESGENSLNAITGICEDIRGNNNSRYRVTRKRKSCQTENDNVLINNKLIENINKSNSNANIIYNQSKIRNSRIDEINSESNSSELSNSNSIYSSIDGMIAFGNAEFSTSEQKSNKSIILNKSVKEKSKIDQPVIHPSINVNNVFDTNNNFKDSIHIKNVDIINSNIKEVTNIQSSTCNIYNKNIVNSINVDSNNNNNNINNDNNSNINNQTTNSNNNGKTLNNNTLNNCISLNGIVFDQQISKTYDSDELLNIKSYSNIRTSGPSKLNSSSNTNIISSSSSNSTSSSTPMIISETSSPSLSPISFGTNSCSNLITPEKNNNSINNANTNVIHNINDTYGISKSNIIFSSQNNDSNRNESSSNSENNLNINSQNNPNVSISFDTSHYSGHFSNLNTSESTYTCISSSIEENSWNTSNNKTNSNHNKLEISQNSYINHKENMSINNQNHISKNSNNDINSNNNANSNNNNNNHNHNADVNRNHTNSWLKRNVWDEDLIVDSFFVG